MRAVDLFCGAGGMSAGLMDAGIEVVTALDHWAVAVNTYNRNIGEHAEPCDLSVVEAASTGVGASAPDIIVAGPPCQDFSTAGKRVEGRQANLTVAFAEIVATCGPDFFLMENVPRYAEAGLTGCSGIYSRSTRSRKRVWMQVFVAYRKCASGFLHSGPDGGRRSRIDG